MPPPGPNPPHDAAVNSLLRWTVMKLPLKLPLVSMARVCPRRSGSAASVVVRGRSPRPAATLVSGGEVLAPEGDSVFLLVFVSSSLTWGVTRGRSSESVWACEQPSVPHSVTAVATFALRVSEPSVFARGLWVVGVAVVAGPDLRAAWWS